MKLKTLIAGTSLALLLGVAAFGQRGPFGPPPTGATGTQPPDPLAAVQTALSLSAAQVESARALLTKQGTDSQPILEELRTKQQALRTLQQSGTASATDLGTALAAVQATEAKLKAVHDKFVSDFANLLTSDQKKIVADTQTAASRIGALARIGLIDGGPGGGFGGPGLGGPGPGGPRGR